MENYKVTIKNCSKELSGKEKVAIKDITDAMKLDSIVTPNECVTIYPDFTAILEVHNENADNKDYSIFVIVGKDGHKYITSSESFISSFENIQEEMEDEEEEWGVKVYKVESKNFKGRYFITCSIV